MSEVKILEELDRLMKQYEQRWGQPVDVSTVSRAFTQEKLCLVLRRIVDTGESVQTGWNHTVECMIRYYERIRPEERRRSCREEGTILGEACPFCKKQVRMWSCGSYGQSHIIRCETAGSMFDTIRGL